MKRLIFVSLFSLIFGFGLIGLEIYKSNDFYYQLTLPATWYVSDEEDSSQIIFANEQEDAAFLIGVFAVEKGLKATDFLQSFIQRMRLKGKIESFRFKTYEACGGTFSFYMNDLRLKAEIIIFNTKSCFFMLMGSSLADSFEKNKTDLKSIFNSFKLDANALDAAYGYSSTDKAKDSSTAKTRTTTTDKRSSYYSIQVDWKEESSFFSFVQEDFDKAVEEGKRIIASGDLFKYYNINPKEDPNYTLTFWSKFFQDMYNKNYLRVISIVEWFKNKASEKKWSAYELAAQVVKCIQAVPYERPYNLVKDKSQLAAVLDYFTPNELAWYNKGDCDTKSMLIIMILRQLGYDVVLYFSDYYKHAMVGININASGAYKVYNGKKYYFIETTVPGWRIGDLPPDFNDVRKWNIFIIQ